MKILVTGAKGFVGKNLCTALKNLQSGKDRTRPTLKIEEVYEYDVDSTEAELESYCKTADFVFHLAGVNRPKTEAEFMQGNYGFSDRLLSCLKSQKNCCPVMLSSSVQASLEGRYAAGEYGKSKRAGEELFFAYGKECGGQVCVYRFPNLFGKWCKPNYNSAVATFCYNIANDLPITVHDRTTELELLYIDDLVSALLDLLQGRGKRCDYAGLQPIEKAEGRYYYVPTTHKIALGEIADLLYAFHAQPQKLILPEMPNGSFAKKLYATYLSYLPKEKAAFDLTMHTDERGSFTELLKTEKCGQVSVNISKAGVTKGQHWHNTKWEFFIVVAGEGLIEQRKIGTDEVLSFSVSGKRLQAVHMLPGYTHKITNLSKTEDLVTVMWANEAFDPDRPDTYYEEV